MGVILCKVESGIYACDHYWLERFLGEPIDSSCSRGSPMGVSNGVVGVRLGDPRLGVRLVGANPVLASLWSAGGDKSGTGRSCKDGLRL